MPPVSNRQNQDDRQRGRDYRRASSMESLRTPSQELIPTLETADPNLAKGSIGGGAVRAGRGANIVDPTNASSQIADLISAGLSATEASIKAVNGVYKIRDAQTEEDMNNELNKLAERKAKGEFTGENAEQNYQNKRTAIIRHFKSQFQTRPYKDRINQLSFENDLSNIFAKSTDALNEFNLKRLRIEQNPLYDTIDNGEQVKEAELEKLKTEFLDKMEREYGTNQAVMLRVYDAAGKVRIPSKEEQELREARLKQKIPPEAVEIINKFNLEKLRIQRDISYASREDGEELRNQALETLQTTFLTTIEERYGDNQAVLLRAYGVTDMIRLTSREAQERQLSSQAGKLYNEYLEKYDSAIQSSINLMAQGGIMYESEAAFVQDILDKAGVPEEIQQNSALRESFLEFAGKKIGSAFNRVQTEIDTRIRTFISDANDIALINAINEARSGSSTPAAKFDGLVDGILDEIYMIPSDAEQRRVLERRLGTLVPILQSMYFMGTPEENFQNAKEQLEAVVREAGFSLNDFDLVLGPDDFNVLNNLQLPPTSDTARRMFLNPNLSDNGYDAAQVEATAEVISGVAIEQIINEAVARTPSLVVLTPAEQEQYHSIAFAILSEYSNSDGVPLKYVIDDVLDELDLPLLSQERADLTALVIKAASTDSAFEVVEQYKESKLTRDWGTFYDTITNKLTVDATGVYTPQLPAQVDLSDFGKYGHRAVIQRIAFQDPNLAQDPEAYVQDVFQRFAASPDVLAYYAQHVAFSSTTSDAFWKDVFQARGITPSEQTLAALNQRFHPETMAAVVKASQEGKPFKLPAFDDIIVSLKGDAIDSNFHFQEARNKAIRSITDFYVRDPEKFEELEPYVSDTAVQWAYLNDIAPDGVTIQNEMKRRGMQVVEIQSKSYIVTDQETLNTALLRSPIGSVYINGVFQPTMDQGIEIGFQAIIEEYAQNEQAKPLVSFLQTLLFNQTERINTTYATVRAAADRSYGDAPTSLFDVKRSLTLKGLIGEAIKIELGQPDLDLDMSTISFKWTEYGELSVVFPKGSQLEDTELIIPKVFADLVGVSTQLEYLKGTPRPDVRFQDVPPW